MPMYLLTDSKYEDEIFERHTSVYIARNKGHVVIKDSTFKRNVGLQGGAVHLSNVREIVISGCVFEENMSYMSGFAIYVSSFSGQDAILMIGNTFTHNLGRLGQPKGGVIYADKVEIRDRSMDDYSVGSS